MSHACSTSKVLLTPKNPFQRFYLLIFFHVIATFMLDAGEELWLWHGWWPETVIDDAEATDDEPLIATVADQRGSSSTRWQAERRAAMQTALNYWKRKYGDNNDDDDPKVYVVWAGLEPHRFTDCFPEWRDHDDIAEINIKVQCIAFVV